MLGSVDKYKTKWETRSILGIDIHLLTLENFEEATDEVIEILQARNEKDIAPEACPYFGQIWAAANALAEWVAKNESALKDKKILEIGCGLAMPSIVAAKLGAHCTCIDLHADVQYFMKENLAKNNVQDQIKFLTCDWQTSPTSLATFDLVMASDVLYENHHAKTLAKFVEKCLSPEGRGVFTDPCRWHHLEFVEELKKLNLKVSYEYHWTKEEGRDLKLCTIEVSRK